LIVWGISNDLAYAEKVISFYPDTFDGVILDCPVGTGAFTYKLYSRYPKATILLADYSLGMLKEAKKRFERNGINNTVFIKADIGNLPIKKQCD